MSAPVSSFYGQSTQRSIDQLRSVTPVQPVPKAGATAVEHAMPPLRAVHGAGDGERRALPAASASALRALGLAERIHPSPPVRDSLTLRRLYQTARRRGLHAAFRNAFWREEAGEGAEELLARASRPGTNEHDIVRLADFQSADPVRRYVFLLEAEHLAQERNAPGAVSDKITQAVEETWARHHEQIGEAFFDKAAPLIAQAEQGEAWNESRSIYFDWVVGAGYVDGVFSSLLSQFGARHLEQGVALVRDTLAADLRSDVVCCDPIRMRQEQMDLETNRLIWSLLKDSRFFLQGRRAGGDPPAPEKVAAFCQEVLGYAAGGASERKLNAICRFVSDDVNGATRARVVGFMRTLPLGIWSSGEARDALPVPHATPTR
jgi:hypothetical protein